MKEEILDEYFEGKKVIVEESIWTNKVTITVEGEALKKIDNKTFLFQKNGTDVQVKYVGNKVSGTALKVEDKTIPVFAKQPIYIWPLVFLPFIAIMILSNIPALGKAGFPVVGGAIGGALSGGLSVLSWYCTTMTKKPILKIIIAFGFLVGTVLLCYLIGLAIVAMM